ncbi:50S ribosomal protein L18 [Candidatus Roizmanbacteria bacterium]|nr:50S ribosomal protein L18 [Candidatus Roizmanbacteria bacterium]
MRTTPKNYKRNRIVVFRSNQHIYAQIIDDVKGATLVSASDHEIKPTKQVKNKTEKEQKTADTPKIGIARQVGTLLAEKAKKQKVGKAYFDRRNYKYHGRIKALAEGARAGGLDF